MIYVIIIIAVIGVLSFGYFLMARLDSFLAENKSSIESAEESREPSCVVLSGDMADENIIKEISSFRQKHGAVRIMLLEDYESNRL